MPQTGQQAVGWDGAASLSQSLHQGGVAVNAGQRVLEIVRDGRQELVTEDGLALGLLDLGLLEALPFVGLKLEGDQVRQKLEDLEDLLGEVGGLGVQGAQDAELLAVTPRERDGDVALDPVQAPGRVIGEAGIRAGVVDEQWRDRATDNASKRRRHVQVIARTEPQPDIVQDGAGGPGVLGDAGDERDAHAGRLAEDGEGGLDSVEAIDRFDISVNG